LFYTEKTATTN